MLNNMDNPLPFIAARQSGAIIKGELNLIAYHFLFQNDSFGRNCCSRKVFVSLHPQIIKNKDRKPSRIYELKVLKLYIARHTYIVIDHTQ